MLLLGLNFIKPHYSAYNHSTSFQFNVKIIPQVY